MAVAGLTWAAVLRDVEPSSGRFSAGHNAIWLEVDWVNAPHSDGQTRALAARLIRFEIKYVFAYASYLNRTGVFNPTHSYAAAFTQQLKAAYPEVKVLAWIGLPLRHRGPFGVGIASGGHVDLGDLTTRRKVTAFCRDVLRSAPFDGVHLDPEPVANGDASVLALLDETRQAIDKGAMLSIATPHIRPILAEVSLPTVGPPAWSAAYYRQVASRVDQIALMAYDSALPLASLYRRWQRAQTTDTAQALAQSAAQILIGVPTWDEQTWTHWPRAENMRNGLAGVTDGLRSLDDETARLVTGVAIYAHWATDTAEWASYEAQWLGRKRG